MSRFCLWLEKYITSKLSVKWKQYLIKRFPRLYNFFKYGYFSLNLNSGNYWDRRFAQYGSFWRNEHYFYIMDLDIFPKNQRFSVLDIGCALGDGCELLRKYYPNVEIEGADISKVAIERARSKSEEIKYYILDILKDDIPRQYDYILLIETLEHFDFPFYIIDKCLRHTRKSIIISVPCMGKIVDPKIRELSEHRYLFNENTFKDYNSKVLKITDYIKSSCSRCIIYEIVK